MCNKYFYFLKLQFKLLFVSNRNVRIFFTYTNHKNNFLLFRLSHSNYLCSKFSDKRINSTFHLKEISKIKIGWGATLAHNNVVESFKDYHFSNSKIKMLKKKSLPADIKLFLKK